MTFFVFSFFSCSNIVGTNIYNKENSFDKDEEKDKDENKDENKDTPENSKEDDEVYKVLNIYNQSEYEVEIYSEASRSSCITKIKSNDNYSYSFGETTDEIVLYLKYIINIGADIPWYSNDSFIAYALSEKDNSVTIQNPTVTSVSQCYVVLENLSATYKTLTRGSVELIPFNKTTGVLNEKETAVYEIKKTNFYNLESFKIQNTRLDSVIGLFESGNIYHVIIKDEGLYLKSVIPFDINTKKQIWNKSVSFFYSDDTFKPVIRPAANLGNGSIMCGSLKNDRKAIGLLRSNVYGDPPSKIPSAEFDSSNKLETSAVLDFAEKDDGSIVLLLQNTYQNETAKQILACYNFENKSLKYIYPFTDTMSFNLSSRNKIILKDNKVYLAGSQISSGKMYPWFGILEESNKTLSSWKSSNYSDFGSGIESMFTSVFYSENENCIYVCGYENCDFNYSSRIHKGIIYKFNSDLTSTEKIFEKDKALFFSIDGDKNGNYFTCGEYADNRILKGIIVSNKDVQNKTNGILFTTDNPYCWFNQLCVYDSKIMLCGKSGSNFSATSNSKPFTACYTFSGKLIWVNDNLGNYTDAVTIIPNKINTYNLELYNSGTRSILLKSADLLGK